jgi:O-methyltransferase
MAPIDGLGERMKKVLIFGAGPSGKRAFAANKGLWSVIAFCDNDPAKWGTVIENISVYPPSEILSLDYDILFIASIPGREQIKQQLHELGVHKSKIYVYRHCATGCELFIKNFAEDVYESTLPGSVAEVGVFRGDVAAVINECFPDRRLYLFDTFEGFSVADVAVEKAHNFSEAKEGEYHDTSENIVMEKMKYNSPLKNSSTLA